MMYIYEACNLFLTLDITLFSPSGRSSGNLPDSFWDRGLFTYLLTGLLTERDFTAYGAAYRHCLRRWLSTDYQGSQLAHCDRKGPKPGACMGWAMGSRHPTWLGPYWYP